ncbi:hypothetical protein XELAEV_18013547mg [Xenopus laevis]|uniref:Uncharacterized protein n=1 Tax=Xenopus laevis TaxID=8355 RepID=A0A974DQ41_XENLA|nr:hypothetical protein XELAEV_18013547mg [Xenopus laevis]
MTLSFTLDLILSHYKIRTYWMLSQGAPFPPAHKECYCIPNKNNWVSSSSVLHIISHCSWDGSMNRSLLCHFLHVENNKSPFTTLTSE